MAILLYDRRVKLELRPAEFEGVGTQRKIVSRWDSVNPYNGWNPVAPLRIKFNIEKNIEATPNKATIDVYNLNSDNRAKPKKDDLVTLYAGYAENLEAQVGEFGPELGELPTVFKGNLTRSYIRKERTDWVNSLLVGDGAAGNGQMNDILPPGSTVEDVIEKAKDRLEELGVDIMSDFTSSIAYWIQDQFGLLSSDPVAAGTSTGGDTEQGLGEALIGGANDLLDKVLKKVGLQHSVQNNVLIVRPKGGSDGQPAVIVSAATGLIDSVQVGEKSVSGKCLLIPQIEPGRLIRIDSLTVQGDYVVTRATYIGDTHGSEWFVNWEAMEPGSRIELGAG